MATASRLLGGAWLWLQTPAWTALSACTDEAARTGATFNTLTPAEAGTMRAFAARIIPSDRTLPGAEEAGAVHFVDRALAEAFAAFLEPMRAGLADLDTRARGKHAKAFAELAETEQDAIMRELEASDFFFFARMLTVMGTFADAAWGGNRDGAGNRILDIEHQPVYQPPFGYYDAEAARTGGTA
jgi:gluconate 2-dehydrogenase gamma chain